MARPFRRICETHGLRVIVLHHLQHLDAIEMQQGH
jgi:hypothetical protein